MISDGMVGFGQWVSGLWLGGRWWWVVDPWVAVMCWCDCRGCGLIGLWMWAGGLW